MHRTDPVPQAPVAVRRRWYAVAALAAGLLALAVLTLLPSVDWLRQDSLIAVDDRHYRLTERDWRAAFEQAVAMRQASEQSALMSLEDNIEALVSDAFTLPRDKVTHVGDWYYSLSGTGTRGLASVAGLWGEDGTEVLARHVSERLFPEDLWATANAALLSTLVAQVDTGSQQSLDRMRTGLRDALSDHAVPESHTETALTEAPAITWQTDALLWHTLSEDSLLADSVTATSVTALGAMATLRVMAQRRAAMTAAARVAGRSTTATGTTACLGTGPWAPLCATGLVAGTVVATEWAILKLDERNNRADFEAALHHDLDRLEAEFRNALQETIVVGLRAEFDARDQLIRAHVRPIDAVFDRPR